MDKRLEQIESYSKRIEENRRILRDLEVDKPHMYEIMEDLDELGSALSFYGNDIRYPLFVEGTQMVLVVRPFEKEQYAKYRLEEKRKIKNRYGEEINIYNPIDPDFTFEMANAIMDKVKENKDAGKYYSNDFPLPMSSYVQSFLVDSWEKIYNGLLDYIVDKLDGEVLHQEERINRTKRYV